MAVLVKVAFKKDDRIPVIKVIREMTGFGLKDALHAADAGMIMEAEQVESMMRSFNNAKERVRPEYNFTYSFSVELYVDVRHPVWLPTTFR